MCKNHFYISYNGNKRNEAKKLIEKIDFKNIEYFVEPFCGSCAVSYQVYLQNPKMKFILNDTNKYLYEMFKIFKDDDKIKEFEEQYKNLMKGINKDKYNTIVKQDNLISWFIKHKVYAIRPGLFPITRKIITEISFKTMPIYDFFRNANIVYTNKNWFDIYNDYRNNKKALIFLDPPYIMSCNDYYIDKKLNVYEYLFYNNISKEKAHITLILENNWIMKLLFQDIKYKLEYDKLYQTTKKQVKHIIISNVPFI